MKSASLLYDELTRIYKKEYNQVFKSKDKDWRQKYDYKNLKDLDYQADETDEEDKTDEAIPEWVEVSKNRFDATKNKINRNIDNGLEITVRDKKITLKD